MGGRMKMRNTHDYGTNLAENYREGIIE